MHMSLYLGGRQKDACGVWAWRKGVVWGRGAGASVVWEESSSSYPALVSAGATLDPAPASALSSDDAAWCFVDAPITRFRLSDIKYGASCQRLESGVGGE